MTDTTELSHKPRGGRTEAPLFLWLTQALGHGGCVYQERGRDQKEAQSLGLGSGRDALGAGFSSPTLCPALVQPASRLACSPYHPALALDITPARDKGGWQTQPGLTRPLLRGDPSCRHRGRRLPDAGKTSSSASCTPGDSGTGLASQPGWAGGGDCRDPTWSQGCLPRRAAPLLQLPDELQQVHLQCQLLGQRAAVRLEGHRGPFAPAKAQLEALSPRPRSRPQGLQCARQ